MNYSINNFAGKFIKLRAWTDEKMNYPAQSVRVGC